MIMAPPSAAKQAASGRLRREAIDWLTWPGPLPQATDLSFYLLAHRGVTYTAHGAG